jgi:thiopurine S-methyltransferase
MDKDFWRARWAEGRTGWHAGSPNHLLVKHFGRLGCVAGDPVLVPLCGKSHDLDWLASEPRCQPIGVEWAVQAVKEYFSDAPVKVSRESFGAAIELWSACGVDILCADWFSVRSEDLRAVTHGQEIRAWWDRASLIALPPESRQDYVARLAAFVPSGARGLLLSLEYPHGEKQGPPFSVGKEEVAKLFSSNFSIEEIACEDALERDERRRAEGMSRLDERLYLLQRR